MAATIELEDLSHDELVKMYRDAEAELCDARSEIASLESDVEDLEGQLDDAPDADEIERPFLEAVRMLADGNVRGALIEIGRDCTSAELRNAVDVALVSPKVPR